MNLKQQTKQKHIDKIETLIDRKEYKEALDIVKKYRIKGYTANGSTLLKNGLGIKPKDLPSLCNVRVRNPFYRCAGDMKLYLIREAEVKFSKMAIRKKKLEELLIN